MTKKEAKARKAAWQKALNESRVVVFNCHLIGQTFREYKTAAEAAQAILQARIDGIPATLAPSV